MRMDFFGLLHAEDIMKIKRIKRQQMREKANGKLTNSKSQHIIYLSRQSVREVKVPCPGEHI